MAVAKRGRPKSQDKLEQIISAASELFLLEGYDRASMQRIAEKADVSKQTLYSHFKNKEDLFNSCLTQQTMHNAEEYEKHASKPFVPGLEGMSMYYLSVISNIEIVRMWRLMVASAETQPKLAKLFFQKGPIESREHFSRFFEKHASELNNSDFDEMARNYISILTGARLYQRMLGVAIDASTKARKRRSQMAIELFKSLYVK